VATALTLFQVGEFAFVLARAGLATGALSDAQYSVILNTAIVTMALTPAVSATAPRLDAWLRSRRAEEPLLTVNVPVRLADHVVIAGAGRVGRAVADALAAMGLPFVLIEHDARRFEQAREAGRAAIYGDAGQAVVLGAAAIERARAILITVPAFSDVRTIVRVVRSIRADLPLIARADGPDTVDALHALGIEEVTSPEFEGAIEMTRQALVRFNTPAERIMELTDAIRRKRQPAADESKDVGTDVR
jgi:CPA2 family monovalent cation:H+ antiporter-2